jgi:hypothetical protein
MFMQEDMQIDGRVDEWEISGKSEGIYLGGGRESIALLEGSQVSPSRASDRNRTKVKTLEW